MSFIGKIVEVEFLDHCLEPVGEKTKDLMRFKVWGVVQSFTKKQLTIRTWELQVGDKETRKHNNEVAKILSASIVSIKELYVKGSAD